MNKEIMKSVFPEEVKRMEKGLCPICAKEIKQEDFRSQADIEEFEISGLCQKCQDKVFTE